MSETATPPSAGEERRVSADPVELFFDLVYVFGVARLVGFLHDDLTLATAGEALLLLGMLWWAWSQFTWAASATGTSTRAVRATFLAATIATVPLAAAVPNAFGADGAVFGIGYAAVRLLGLAVYLVGSPDPAHRRTVARFAALSLVAPALAVAGGFAPDDVRWIVWVVVLVVEVGAAIASGGQEFRIVPSHFSERHGLFVIVALGETVVAVGLAVSGQLQEPTTLLALGLGGLFGATLWWAYFDRVAPAAEAALAGAHGAARAVLARDLYTLGHFPVVSGIVLSAVALEFVAAHPDDPLGSDVARVMAAGSALIWVGLALLSWRATTRVPEVRLGLAAALVVSVLLLGDASGLVALAVVDLLVVGGLLLEERLRPQGSW